MLSQMPSLSKHLMAFGAFVWLVSRVRPEMRSQISRLTELLEAVGGFARLAVRRPEMLPEMRAQSSPFTERFVALGALIGLLFRV